MNTLCGALCSLDLVCEDDVLTVEVTQCTSRRRVSDSPGDWRVLNILVLHVTSASWIRGCVCFVARLVVRPDRCSQFFE